MTFEMKFSQIDQCFRPKFENFVELGEPILIEGSFTENGEYNAINSGANGYDKVVVNVQPPLQNKTVTENGTHTADGEYYGLGEVVVNVPPPPPQPDPNLKKIIDGTITELYCEEATEMRMYSFYSCTKLEKVYLPLINDIATRAFYDCSNLKVGIFSTAGGINSFSFYGGSSLVSIILGKTTSRCYLYATSAFNNCYHILGTVNATYNPEGKKDGYIYVPLSLVAEYRVATNWTTYATQIMPIVSTVDGLAEIDGTTYDHACVWAGGEDFTEYYFNGTAWEVFTR